MYSAVNNEIFKILKGLNFSIKMFDENFNGPILDPENSRFIFASKLGSSLMISMPDEDTQKYPEVIIYKEEDFDSDMFKNINTRIKNVCIKNGYITSTRIFGKEINPKDFKFKGKINQLRNIEESYTVKGTSKSSYHVESKVKIICRHNKKIDENKKYARSKNIKEIFVQDMNGERRIIPTKNMYHAKALASYIKHGGKLFDENSNKIMSLCENLSYLKSKRKISLNECPTNETVLELNDIIQALTSVVNKISGKKQSKILDLLIPFTKSDNINEHEDNICDKRLSYAKKIKENYDKFVVESIFCKMIGVNENNSFYAECYINDRFDMLDSRCKNLLEEIVDNLKSKNITSEQKEFYKVLKNKFFS